MLWIHTGFAYLRPSRYSELNHFLLGVSLNPAEPSLLGSADHSSPGVFCASLWLTLSPQPLFFWWSVSQSLPVTLPCGLLKKIQNRSKLARPSARPAADPQGTLAHLWPPFGEGNHRCFPGTALSCRPRPPDMSQVRDTTKWWLPTLRQHNKLWMCPWGSSFLRWRRHHFPPFSPLYYPTLLCPLHQGRVRYFCDAHFEICILVCTSLCISYLSSGASTKTYFNIQLYQLFKSYLFVFPQDGFPRGSFDCFFFFLNFSAWLNDSNSVQMCRENESFFIALLTDLAFLASWIVGKGTTT